MTVRVGIAPDSWGVWFPDDPRQPPWQQFLDEVVVAGYDTIELGPYGYLPTDPAKLQDEVGRRGLRVTAGFMMGDLHRRETWNAFAADIDRACDLLIAVGASHLILIPGMYSDLFTGARTGQAELDPESWTNLVEATHRVADQAAAKGLRLAFHPHAETPVELPSQIERFLADTDPARVGLCLDTGHHAYRGGDPVDLVRRHGERVVYLHLKSVAASIRDQVQAQQTSFAKAVDKGIFVEPQHGTVDFPRLVKALDDVGYDGYGIVEQDMYPTEFDKPLPIARRTRDYLQHIGIQ